MKKKIIMVIMLIVVCILVIIAGTKLAKKPAETQPASNPNETETVPNQSETNQDPSKIELPDGIKEEELKQYLGVFALSNYQSERLKELNAEELQCVRAVGMAIQLYEQVNQKEFELSGKFGKVYNISLIKEIVKEIMGNEWLEKNIDDNDIIKTNNKVFTYAELEDAYHRTELFDDLKLEGECTEIVSVNQKDNKQFEVKYKYRIKNDDDSFSDTLESSITLQENDNFVYSKYKIN